MGDSEPRLGVLEQTPTSVEDHALGLPRSPLSSNSLDEMAPCVSCRKVLTLEKEENQTFGFEIQVGEAGRRASEGLGGQSEEWMAPANPGLRVPLSVSDVWPSPPGGAARGDGDFCLPGP